MMRAKMSVRSVTPYGTPVNQENIHFSAVTGKEPFGPDGESEDNTYARYTPMAELTMSVNNPALLGRIKVGESYYVDFIKAAE